MLLKKNKFETLEVSDLELINKFLQSDSLYDVHQELAVRFAMFICTPEPKGLGYGILNADEWQQAFDLLELQILIRRIKIPEAKTHRHYKIKSIKTKE